MNEVSFSTKPKEKKIVEDRNWFKQECVKCPYFVNDEILKTLHCVRPVNEECLLKGILVIGTIMAEKHNEMVKEFYEKKPDPIINELTKKRRAKIFKRRR